MTYPKTGLNKVRRLPDRGAYDRETIYAIVDASLVCHVGFVADGQPFVIPTLHARLGDELYLHGAKASRLLKHVASGQPVSVCVTLLDGIVLARSLFESSLNYRSAVLFGRGRLVEDEAEKLRGLAALSDQVMPGRWEDARQPNAEELRATTVVAIHVESASAKVRSGPGKDKDEDYALPVWAGVLPMEMAFLEPVPDPSLAAGIEVPGYLRGYLWE
jgi:hypothetical protein